MKDFTIRLPTLHDDQVRAFDFIRKHQYSAIRCGRRWGKSTKGVTVAANDAANGDPVGWFAPDYKLMLEVFNLAADVLKPIITQKSKTEKIIRTNTGGLIEFWTLENDDAGRSRRYKRAIIDEAAFTKPNMMEIWERSIKPTLLDYDGSCIAFSNTNGNDPENFFWKICNDSQFGFKNYHAPSTANPLLPLRHRGETDVEHHARRLLAHKKWQDENAPLVYQQEYLAEFVDWSGIAFFAKDKLLVNDQPVEFPKICDAVFAIIDSATKTGSGNDGTAVIYYAVSHHAGHPLVVLDWDIVQIEGALLETWLPTVLQNCEHFARVCKARRGSIGALIEDKDSGQILIQQSARRGLLASPIPAELTAKGKDGRAISVSGYVYQGLVKIARQAYDKVTNFKGTTKNHFVAQVLGFRIGDKEAAKRADDLLDCFTYGIAVALGDSKGN